MDKSDVLTLISEEFKIGDYGQEIAAETKRDVFCKISSIGSDEFFKAGNAGLKAKYKVTMFYYDYQNEELAEINGERYAVYRNYFANNENIELYLSEKVGV